jgi:hypothetical protein
MKFDFQSAKPLNAPHEEKKTTLNFVFVWAEKIFQLYSRFSIFLYFSHYNLRDELRVLRMIFLTGTRKESDKSTTFSLLLFWLKGGKFPFLSISHKWKVSNGNRKLFKKIYCHYPKNKDVCELRQIRMFLDFSLLFMMK